MSLLPLYDSSLLPEPQRTWFDETIAAHTFNMNRCQRHLVKISRFYGSARKVIKPVIEDLEPLFEGGTPYAATWPDGRIKFDIDMAPDEEMFIGCSIHENSHSWINWFVGPKNLRGALVRIYSSVYGPVPWNDIRDADGNVSRPGMSHPLCAGFTKAFSPFDADDPIYPPVDPIPELIRELVG